MSKVTRETFRAVHQQFPEQWRALVFDVLERGMPTDLQHYNGCVRLSNGVSYFTDKTNGEITCS